MGPTAPHDWDRVIDINLSGAWRTLRPRPRTYSRPAGTVAVSSMIAYIHPPLLASYAAGKAGVAAMADAVRLEMRAVGVTVGTVHRVVFRTPMIGDALSSPAAVELAQGLHGRRKPVELDTVVDGIVRGIDSHSERIVVPRQHAPTALVPGLAQAAIDGSVSSSTSPGPSSGFRADRLTPLNRPHRTDAGERRRFPATGGTTSGFGDRLAR